MNNSHFCKSATGSCSFVSALADSKSHILNRSPGKRRRLKDMDRELQWTGQFVKLCVAESCNCKLQHCY